MDKPGIRVQDDFKCTPTHHGDLLQINNQMDLVGCNALRDGLLQRLAGILAGERANRCKVSHCADDTACNCFLHRRQAFSRLILKRCSHSGSAAASFMNTSTIPGSSCVPETRSISFMAVS